VLKIDKAYRVISVDIKQRKEITAAQSGVALWADTMDEYWLFELGEILSLNNILINLNVSGFRQSLKLTTLAMIEKADVFDDLETIYTSCVV
jgi:hypothetical protein